MPLINHDTIPYPARSRLAKPPTSGKKPITKTRPPSKPIIRTGSKKTPPSSKKTPPSSKKTPPSSKKTPPSSKKTPPSSKKTPQPSKPLEMLSADSKGLVTKQARQSASPKKIKPIDIVRASRRLAANAHTGTSEQKYPTLRKVREKPYVSLFLKHHGASAKYKSIQQGDIDPNELQIKINIPEGSDINRFEIGLHFDHQDDVRTIIITDKKFYDGLFYTEVIKTERYKEAWQIMRHRYLLDSWIDKYIYFLLHAPSILPILMG